MQPVVRKVAVCHVFLRHVKILFFDMSDTFHFTQDRGANLPLIWIKDILAESPKSLINP
jgi:hypothetical protein